MSPQGSDGYDLHNESTLLSPQNQGRSNVLGVGISEINPQIALNKISHWVAIGGREYVCVCTVHTVMECHRSERLRQVVNASGINTPDGMPLVWLASRSGGKDVSRVYGPDLMLSAMKQSAHSGWRHFLYGGREGVAQRLAESLEERFPGTAIVGSLTPAMAPVEQLCTAAAAGIINAARPDIVWVGISTPKQELWMSMMRPLLTAPVLIGVGAAFDFHSGNVRQAPRWMQQSGLEWLFRLVQEPKRLWRRYLLDNPRFIYEIALQKLQFRRYTL